MGKEIFASRETAWCPGCGNFAILEALKEALVQLGKKPQEVLIVSGIGQAAKLPHYIKANGFNGLHGRALPAAVGAKIANKDLLVLVHSGDGDSYGEGGNHFLHNIRRNVDITHFVHDNQIYALTKGQASPTTQLGQVTGVQTIGNLLPPLNPLLVAIAAGAGFVARAFSGDQEHLVEVMKAAILHQGYSLVDILQPCVSFNKVNTFAWYKQRVYRLGADYDHKDKIAALKKALEWETGIPLGIIYREEKISYLEQIAFLQDGPPLVDRELDPLQMSGLMEEFF